MDNKAPMVKFTKYYALNAPIDHIYAVSDKMLFKKPDAIKGDRSRRDACKFFHFHDDI